MNHKLNEPEFSIVVPVLNEAGAINPLIDHILALPASERCEIIVVDGDSQSRTLRAIENADIVKISSDIGRAKQMNAGASIARGQILIFLHADTKLPDNALLTIAKTLANTEYVAGAFDLGIDSDRLFLKFIAARTRLRSRLTRVPYGDQAIFIRKSYFDKIGQFAELPFLEDVDLMQRIKKRGDRICIVGQRVSTSARRWEKEGVFYTTIRNHFVMTLHRFGVSPHKLARFYRRH